MASTTPVLRTEPQRRLYEVLKNASHPGWMDAREIAHALGKNQLSPQHRILLAEWTDNAWLEKGVASAGIAQKYIWRVVR